MSGSTPMPWTDEEDDAGFTEAAPPSHPTPQRKPSVPNSTKASTPYGDNTYGAGGCDTLNRLGAGSTYGDSNK